MAFKGFLIAQNLNESSSLYTLSFNFNPIDEGSRSSSYENDFRFEQNPKKPLA